ncbi:fumarylacetoacetate hydrolase family protein [Alteriqipengyuania lutimaris]|uniref:FAA hydrolase family protein n=1 Tax=Alteriqipengyuania lutimaris TaxID=1538146 RepID=A0A395LJG0_9SPHN|nr:fumarylacetoacetate hydrolase family protein [Alteriqipengyuania lutimaris]MBB3033929.1 fumarylacetoacetate (FAA) hydrolase [Alteriqipengyuania lutimaris]RDS77113.1 FAA hydrolase family protein [Alteriqipengyuania lutimaris]
MKLATLNNGTRDGKLVVVSKDITRYCAADNIAETMQDALDDWANTAPKLEALYRDVNNEAVPCERFHEREAHSPLPRAYQWADGSAYINHVELVRKARGAEVPESFYHDPLMYQGGSDDFLPPRADIPLKDTSWGCDMEGEIACITDDVPMGVSSDEAADHIKLLMLVNDVSLRGLIPGELAKGFGFFQSKPATAFSPVAITPDELGDAWKDAVIQLPLMVDYNGDPFGRADVGQDATFSLADLVAHAAKTRNLGAGCIIGSGTISNQGPDGDPGKPVSEGGKGYSCIAEIRMIETIASGEAKTRFMEPGDTVKIWMEDDHGKSIFGSIEQKVVQA